MKYPIPEQQVAEEVVAVCNRNCLTPFGLLSQIRDIRENPELYGTDLERETMMLEAFEGTRIDEDDVTEQVCRLATHLMRKPPTQTTDDNDTIVVSFKRTK